MTLVIELQETRILEAQGPPHYCHQVIVLPRIQYLPDSPFTLDMLPEIVEASIAADLLEVA